MGAVVLAVIAVAVMYWRSQEAAAVQGALSSGLGAAGGTSRTGAKADRPGDAQARAIIERNLTL